MANFVYTNAKLKVAKGDLDFDTADIRARLLMSNTTAASAGQEDATNITGITTLDEYNGSGYTAATLGTSSVAADNTNNRAEVDYADFTFGSAVGPGTRNAVAILFYVRVDGTNANDYPLAYVDTVTGATFPFNGNGGAINYTVNVEGLIWVS